MDYVEQMAAEVILTRRSGGVIGGHVHASFQCGYCSRGLANYAANAA
jgi:hypothetical protein